MFVTINYLTLDDCTNNGVDIRRFLDLLGPSKVFDTCEVFSSWGLIIFKFSRPSGSAQIPVSIELLKLIDGTVIDDSGHEVSRWDRIAEELINWADQKVKLGHAPVSTQTKH